MMEIQQSSRSTLRIAGELTVSVGEGGLTTPYEILPGGSLILVLDAFWAVVLL